MKFMPLYKNKVWGGNKIKSLGFDYDPLPNCGELWALSAVKDNESVIQGIERVSTPGRRVYASAEDLPRVLNGLGVAVISTDKGLLTDRECRRDHVGGEVICKIW